jgi:HD-GYP domain-containing protein (c-di-GMP phosphodiesterase class II)
MSTRSRSITRELVLRMVVAGLVLGAIVGAGTYVLERRRIAAAIEERATLGVELLRASVRQLALSTGEPWQQVLPRALQQLVKDIPAAEVGRFAYVEVLGVDGRPLASAEDASLAGMVARARAGGFKAQVERLELTPSGDGPGPGSGVVAVAAPVADRAGTRLAQINGVFVISPQVLAEARTRLVLAVLSAVSIVLAATLLIYPIIRRLVRRLSELSMQLLDANLETLQVLGSAIAKRDSDTDAHNHRVTVYSVRLAEASLVDSAVVRRLIKGAFLHDVGKIGVRDDILLKPGRLTPPEFEIMKTHVTHGLDIIARSKWLQDAGEVVGSHHEKYAGTGYLHGLRSATIPLTARIFAIADVFDALTSERPYKKPMTVAESMAILDQGAGQHFDPALLSRFETIADDLHARFASDDEAARNDLAAIIDRYFKADLGVVLAEAAAGAEGGRR